MLVWQDRRSGTFVENWSIYGARVSTEGVVLDPDGIPISADDTKYEGIPELCFNGTNYLVVWKDDGFTNLGAAIVSPDGAVQVGEPFPVTGANGYETFHAISSDGTNWIVIWEDFRSNNTDIFGTRVDPSGNILDPYPNDCTINVSSTWQFSPKATFNGNETMVIWQERVFGNEWDVRGTRVATDGTPLDVPAIDICIGYEDQLAPDIAFGNSVYLAVWIDFEIEMLGKIAGTRISEDGIVLDGQGFEIGGGIYGGRIPKVAFDGTNFLVTWWEYFNGTYNVFATRVTEDGVVLDTDPIYIAAVSTDYGWNNYVDISIAFNGENYLVVWPEFIEGDWDIYRARVTPSAEVLDIEGFPVSAYGEYQYYPNLVSSDSQWLVVWTDKRNEGHDIYGARIESNGTVLEPDGFEICADPMWQGWPVTGYDGTSYVVIWSDWRNFNPDVYGTGVDLNGYVLDPNGISLISDPLFQEFPIISSGTNGQSLVFFSGYEPTVYSATRIWGGVFNNPFTGIDKPVIEPSIINQISIIPNPFALSTKVIFDLKEAGVVKIEIFDITGRYISTLHNGVLPTGYHEIGWDGCNEQGNTLESGIYFCRFTGEDQEETIKMILK